MLCRILKCVLNAQYINNVPLQQVDEAEDWDINSEKMNVTGCYGTVELC